MPEEGWRLEVAFLFSGLKQRLSCGGARYSLERSAPTNKEASRGQKRHCCGRGSRLRSRVVDDARQDGLRVDPREFVPPETSNVAALDALRKVHGSSRSKWLVQQLQKVRTTHFVAPGGREPFPAIHPHPDAVGLIDAVLPSLHRSLRADRLLGREEHRGLTQTYV